MDLGPVVKIPTISPATIEMTGGESYPKIWAIRSSGIPIISRYWVRR